MDVFGRVPTYRKGVKRSVDVHGGVGTFQKAVDASWWLSGGISPDDVAGVWQPKGAASLDASYLRLAGDEGYANIDPAVVGGVAPTFGADGWISNGSTQYLKLGVIYQNTYTLLARMDDAANSGYMGSSKSGTTTRVYLAPHAGDAVLYGVGSYVVRAPGISTDCVIGFAGYQPYRNGYSDGAAIPDDWSGINDLGLYALAANFNNVTGSFFDGKTKAIAIYKSTITAAQVLAVSTAMAAL